MSPATKLHITVLIIKRKPCNVYFTRALEYSWRDIQAASIRLDHNVCLECPVKTFISTETDKQIF